jgi:hypothetical protein
MRSAVTTAVGQISADRDGANQLIARYFDTIKTQNPDEVARFYSAETIGDGAGVAAFWHRREQVLGRLVSVELFAREGGIYQTSEAEATYWYFDMDTTSTGGEAQELVISLRPSGSHDVLVVGHVFAVGATAYCLLGPSALTDFVMSEWEQRPYIAGLLSEARGAAGNSPHVADRAAALAQFSAARCNP